MDGFRKLQLSWPYLLAAPLLPPAVAVAVFVTDTPGGKDIRPPPPPTPPPPAPPEDGPAVMEIWLPKRC